MAQGSNQLRKVTSLVKNLEEISGTKEASFFVVLVGNWKNILRRERFLVKNEIERKQ